MPVPRQRLWFHKIQLTLQILLIHSFLLVSCRGIEPLTIGWRPTRWPFADHKTNFLVPRGGLEPPRLKGGRFWVCCVYQFRHQGFKFPFRKNSIIKIFLNGTDRLCAAHFTPTFSPWFHSETPTSLRFNLPWFPWLARLPLSIIPHLRCYPDFHLGESLNIKLSSAETTRGNRFRFPLS